MVIYFVISIINSMAQTYLHKSLEETGREKKETGRKKKEANGSHNHSNENGSSSGLKHIKKNV